MEHSYVNICMITDDNYIVPTMAAIQSMKDTMHESSYYRLFVITGGLSEKSGQYLKKLESDNLSITIICEDANGRFAGYRLFEERKNCTASIAALLKLRIPDLLKDINRVLYLDSDIIVKHDLSDLYGIHLSESSYIAAAVEPDGNRLQHDIANGVEKYFNCGVMIMNLQKMRDDNVVSVLQETGRNINDSSLMEQKVYNLAFAGKFTELPIRFNFMPVILYRDYHRWTIDQINSTYHAAYKNKNELFADASIIHFSSQDKPWKDPDGAFASEWISAYLRAPLKNELIPVSDASHDGPAISVIIPCYNVEKYIGDALESILFQTFNDLEILCLDDGSTDSTKEIIREYTVKYNNVFLYTDTNHGPGYERNKGVHLARGKYIHFMDSDDLLDKHFYEILFRKLSENDLDIVCCDGQTFYDSEKLEKDFPEFKNRYKRKEAYPKVYAGEELYILLRKAYDFIVPVGMQMFRREFLLETEPLFPELFAHEDNLFQIRVLPAASRVLYVSAPLYLRRIRENSIMTSKKELEKTMSWIEVIRLSIEVMQSCYEKKQEVFRTVKKHIERFLRALYNSYGRLEAKEKEQLMKQLSDSQTGIFRMCLSFQGNKINHEEVWKKLIDQRSFKMMEEKTIKTVSEDRCTGCGACYNACPVNAISMQYNSEGFIYPVVNAELCVGCTKCRQVCPEVGYDGSCLREEGECYAVMASDEIRKVSSSGGMFTLLAEFVLNQGGAVCGAAYASDYRKVQHIIVESSEELNRLRSSKYVQSETGDCYSQIKQILEVGRKVLFTGCPCQVSGLYGFLEKDYDNLITADLVCHGSNSLKAYQLYLKEIAKGREISRVDFREKENYGWRSNVNIYFADGTNYIEHPDKKKSSWYIGFLQGIMNRLCCSTCHYAAKKRTGDFTLGDFWQVNRYNPEFNDGMGTSVVICNSLKSKSVFDSLKPSMKLCEAAPLDFAAAHNGQLRQPKKMSGGRKYFFQHLDKDGYHKALWYGQKKRYDFGVIENWQNHGHRGLLAGFSLAAVADDCGILPIVISSISGNIEKGNAAADIEFMKRFFNVSKQRKPENMPEINHFCDQMLLGPGNKETIPLYFVNDSKRIACWPENILEPLLVCDQRHLDSLVQKSDMHPEKPYVAALLDKWTEQAGMQLDRLGQKLGCQLVVYAENNSDSSSKVKSLADISTEDIAALVKGSRFCVTDRYDMVCLTLRFHRPFAAIASGSDEDKIMDLLKRMGLENCMTATEGKEAVKFEEVSDIDYSRIDDILSGEQKRAHEWLEHTWRNNKQTKEDALKNHSINDKKPYDVGITGYWWSSNYGSVVTYYALYRLVEQMGLKPILLDRPEKEKHGDGLDVFSRIFMETHCRTTNSLGWNELENYNSIADTFMIGSDQVWGPGAVKSYKYFFFLDFIKRAKKKIAYAASFGEHFNVSDEIMKNARKCISEFDLISVREKSAVGICQEKFGRDATWVLDPAFLLDVSEYDKIAAASKREVEHENYLVTYILEPSEEKKKIILEASRRLGLPMVNILHGKAHSFKKNHAVMNLPDTVRDVGEEDWLYYIKHAKYMITDSHHGTVMAVVYNKQFICCSNKPWGRTRFRSILGLLGLMDRWKVTLEDIEKERTFEHAIDYSKVNAVLNSERKRCLRYLTEALGCDYDSVFGEQMVKSEDPGVHRQIASLQGELEDLKQSLDQILKNQKECLELLRRLS